MAAAPHASPVTSGGTIWDSDELPPFCPQCGALLVLPDVGDVHCDGCPWSCRMQGALWWWRWCHGGGGGGVRRAAAAASRRPRHVHSPPAPLAPPADLPHRVVLTTSFPKPVPQWLREYNQSIGAGGAGGGGPSGGKKGGRSTVAEECPSCKAPEVYFWTMQLRSADEGQTVFYECSCGHTWSLNT